MVTHSVSSSSSQVASDNSSRHSLFLQELTTRSAKVVVEARGRLISRGANPTHLVDKITAAAALVGRIKMLLEAKQPLIRLDNRHRV
jgi:hypothetical protein